MKNKEENNNVEDHILSLFIPAVNSLTGSVVAISTDKINQWRRLEQFAHNGTCQEIKTTIWNQ